MENELDSAGGRVPGFWCSVSAAHNTPLCLRVESACRGHWECEGWDSIRGAVCSYSIRQKGDPALEPTAQSPAGEMKKKQEE